MALKKELDLLDVFSIAAGAMVSSGLFVLPGIAFAYAGPSVVVSYFLAGLLMLPSMCAQAELATAMPKSGGSYFYINRSLGPVFGTFAGFSDWMSIALKATFALVGIGAVAASLVPGDPEWVMKGTAIGACAVFTVLNLVSVKSTGRLQVVMVLGLVAALVVFIGGTLPRVQVARFEPFMTNGVNVTLATAGIVFVSFGGLTKVANVSEEVRNPSRNIPLGMILAFSTVNLLYLLSVFATVGVVPAERLAGSLTPLADAAGLTIGNVGVALVGVAALLAFITTANAGILSAARSPMAMSRDGLVPEFLSRVSPRFNTPHVAIVLTSVGMMLVIAFLSIENLVKTASTFLIIVFVMVNLSVLVMRNSGIQNYRPTFKAPFHPWLQIVMVALYAVVIYQMGKVPLLLAAGFTLAACLWYILYVHNRIEHESALVHIVKRTVAKDIARSNLEDELRQIALERDEIELDRFDHLVLDTPILDLPESISAREMFRRIAAELAPHTQLDEDTLLQMFLARERESSTVIHPGLAVPHVIVSGERLFHMILVRCVEGVVFSELNEPVRTVFALVGSQDQRNFHLRALMNIARIVEEPGFADRWLAARGVEELRDVLLLSKRSRPRRM